MNGDPHKGSAVRSELRFLFFERMFPEGPSLMLVVRGNYQAISSCLLILVVAFFAGCSKTSADKWQKKRPAVYKAKGLVNYNGEPVDGATVLYFNAEQTAHATTDAHGYFTMTTFEEKDGAVEGTHKVSIRKTFAEKGEDRSAEREAPKTRPEELIPAKYGKPETSNLTAEVTSNGTNFETFELED